MLALVQTPPDVVLLSAERCRRSLALFSQRAWQFIDPAPLVWNWHLDEICAALEAVTAGEVRDLLINVPPGHAKSMIVSVMWPAWLWARDPTTKLITASYLDTLVMRDAVRFRDLITTPWFQEHFVASRVVTAQLEASREQPRPAMLIGPWEWKHDQATKEHMKNTAGGERIGVSTGSGTGHRADFQIIDDPLSVEMSKSKVEREAVIRWFYETMASRAQDPANLRRVIIMQRLHEQDLAGEAISRGGFEQLVLPAEFVPARRAEVRAQHGPRKGSVVAQDRRTEAGELLFPRRFPREVIDFDKSPKGMGAQAHEAQNQQNPTPPSGNLIKREWFNRRWRMRDEKALIGYETRILSRVDQIVMSTDAAFKAHAASDLVAIGVWGFTYPDLYLLDLVWQRMTFTETLAALRGLHSTWKRVSACFVEDKANGSALIDVLHKEIPGVIPIEPHGGKEARVNVAARFIEAGNVWLPQGVPARCEGLALTGALIEEAVSFPNAAHDDGIDMLAQTVIKMLGDPATDQIERLVKAMEAGR